MKLSSDSRHKRIRNVLIFLASFVILWYLLCVILNEPMRLASPHRVIYALVHMSETVAFWETILHSAGRILFGSFIGCFIGAALSFAEQDLSLSIFRSFEKYFKALPLLPILLAVSFIALNFSNTIVVLSCIIVSSASMRKTLQIGHQSLSKELLLTTKCNSSYWETVYYLRLPHLQELRL